MFWDVCATEYNCKKRVFIEVIKFKGLLYRRSIIEKVGKEIEKTGKKMRKAPVMRPVRGFRLLLNLLGKLA